MTGESLTQILNLGANGVILAIFILIVWKGIPTMNAFLRELLTTFKQEVKYEREFGAEQLRLERMEREKHIETLSRSLELNTEAVKKNTDATNSLERVVHELVNGKGSS